MAIARRPIRAVASLLSSAVTPSPYACAITGMTARYTIASRSCVSNTPSEARPVVVCSLRRWVSNCSTTAVDDIANAIPIAIAALVCRGVAANAPAIKPVAVRVDTSPMLMIDTAPRRREDESRCMPIENISTINANSPSCSTRSGDETIPSPLGPMTMPVSRYAGITATRNRDRNSDTSPAHASTTSRSICTAPPLAASIVVIRAPPHQSPRRPRVRAGTAPPTHAAG